MSVQIYSSIRVDLDENHTQRFQALKDYFGIQTTTDMVRFLITSKFREISGDPSPPQRKGGLLTENEQYQLENVAKEYYEQFQDLDEAGVQGTLEDRYPTWSPEKIQAGVEYVCSLKKN